MKRQSREVYGYGAKLRTTRLIPSAGWVFFIIVAAMTLGGVSVGLAWT